MITQVIEVDTGMVAEVVGGRKDGEEGKLLDVSYLYRQMNGLNALLNRNNVL